MPRFLSLEFWLIALLVLLIFVTWLWRFGHIDFAIHFIPIVAVAWTVLAILWLIRGMFRRIRG
ncbi:MAG TPA: hypothetical protein VE986_02225 [Hyphomicrobiales bacterium]|nr:hypothetical protein [Hyphomicrobiales bacterium]